MVSLNAFGLSEKGQRGDFPSAVPAAPLHNILQYTTDICECTFHQVLRQVMTLVLRFPNHWFGADDNMC